jgi:predicted metal-dependent phosphoesterase TrpH
MNEKKADLHLHTNFSDSTFSPVEVVTHAVSAGLAAIAITDHDSVSGIQPAIDAGSKLNIEVIPGIEMTTGIDGNEVHVLGYYIDWKEEWFRSRLRELCKARVERVSEMTGKLNRIGIDLSADEVMKINGSPESVGRLHVALALVHKKIVTSVEEAFQKFLKKVKTVS